MDSGKIYRLIAWKDAGDFDAKAGPFLPGRTYQAVVFLSFPLLLEKQIFQVGSGFAMH